jgi:hypothetical protein
MGPIAARRKFIAGTAENTVAGECAKHLVVACVGLMGAGENCISDTKLACRTDALRCCARSGTHGTALHCRMFGRVHVVWIAMTRRRSSASNRVAVADGTAARRTAGVYRARVACGVIPGGVSVANFVPWFRTPREAANSRQSPRTAFKRHWETGCWSKRPQRQRVFQVRG